MKEHISELTSQEFHKKIAKGSWVVDFWAAWCGPCKILGPIMDEVAKDVKDSVNIAKVDVDAEQDLAQQYEVMSIPTVIFFKDGEVVNQFVGVHEKEDILEMIKENFK